MTSTNRQPLPKPDKPGPWRVRWSNGDTADVEVIVSGTTFWFRRGPGGDLYRVNEGWLGQWRPIDV